jgi:uncharacterized membrane protein
MWARRIAFVLALLFSACSDDGAAPVDAAGGGDGPPLINGCPSLSAPQAQPGDPIDGDTFASFAGPLFTSYCTRCHSTTLTGAARNGAPIGFDWDSEASVRIHLAEIRNAVGVLNFMPPSDPEPSCAERQRLVRWIDAAAP